MNVELLSPAGSYESLYAAINGGADSIYFGAGELNMRARSSFNFKEEDINKVVKICAEEGVKTYLALNAVIYDEELGMVRKILVSAKQARVSAIIASDAAVIKMAHSLGLRVHVSVQANVSNTEAVRFYSRYADVIVLARELSLEQIKKIISNIKKEKIKGPSEELVKIEIFVHGALCVSISGKCYMSLAVYNASANRGACYQNCRRSYKVIDESNGNELVIKNKYVMSPKDICLIRCLDKIVDSGVSILKIEGRGRSPDYVYAVTKAYREALNAIPKGTYTRENIKKWEKELGAVFNRGFWHGGYYLGSPMEMWSNMPDNKAGKKKVRVGLVTNYFAKIKVAEITLREGDMSVDDEVLFIGETTGAVKETVKNIRFEEKDIPRAGKGMIISIPLKNKVRRNDAVFVMKLNS